jgi:uncharacterized membrane protein
MAPDSVVQTSRWMALCSLLALIALGLVWELWLAPTGQGSLALKVIPLVLPLAGVFRHRMYTYRWVSLLVWIYFAEGLVRASSEISPTGRLLAWIEVLLCVVLFVACALQVRWRLKRARSAVSVPPSH